jgi:apolipoprotein N-acyltransferase
MNFEKKIDLLLYKKYFDTGWGLTSYLKYALAFFGLASQDVQSTLIIATIYGLSCFIIGYYWLKSDFYKADLELNNRYNIFVEEMRKRIKVETFK